MDSKSIVGIISVLFAIVSGGAILYILFGSRRQVDLKALMAKGGGGSTEALSGRVSVATRGSIDDDDLERIKQQTKRGASIGKQKLSIEQRFFQAGIFSDAERQEFARMRVLLPIFTTIPALIGTGYIAGIDLAIVGGIVGLLLGLQAPFSILDRKIKGRSEDIMFYLPLVIEQIAIGVSSSLDVGPCIQRVVSMADERDSHNVVTELLRTVQFYVKSGVSLEDALNEVGKLAGNTELKHAFMSLSQVAKHGGEVTRQLQELADAVATQRESKIDSKIKKLELEATAPVALVFFGFLIILLIGFGLQILNAF